MKVKMMLALSTLVLGMVCGADDFVKVTTAGKVEYAGRFVGKKWADCDVGPLSRIVMHLGTGIAIQQGLLQRDAELEGLVDRMMSDRPDADAAADAVSRRIEAAVHESAAAYLARRLFCGLRGYFFAWWSCLPQEKDPRYMKGADGVVMQLETFTRFAQLIACDGDWQGRRIVPEDWFKKHPIISFQRGDDWLKVDAQGGFATFALAPRPVRNHERMNAKDSLGATKYQILKLEPKGNVKRRAIADSIHLPDGRLLVVFDRMTAYGDDAHSDMCAVWSSDNGKTWSEEVKLFGTPKGSLNMAGPSLINLRNGELGLMHLHKRSQKDCRPVFRRSKDGGRTWSDPKCVIDDVSYYSPANGMITRDSQGRIHYPADCESRGYVFDCYSDDEGATWKISSRIPFGKKPNKDLLRLEEPNVFERKDGTLVMSLRTNADYIYFADSKDGGATWGPIYRTTLRTPRHPAKIIRIPDGRLVATWIDHEGRPEQMFKMPYHRGTRAPYTVGLSSDEGRTWTHRMVLEPTGWNSNGGMHYHDGCLYINYGMDDFNSTRLVKIPVADFDLVGKGK